MFYRTSLPTSLNYHVAKPQLLQKLSTEGLYLPRMSAKECPKDTRDGSPGVSTELEGYVQPRPPDQVRLHRSTPISLRFLRQTLRGRTAPGNASRRP